MNGVALAALLIQGAYGFVIDPVEQGAIIVLVNLALRAMTNEGLEP